jgi:hypothetical protein
VRGAGTGPGQGQDGWPCACGGCAEVAQRPAAVQRCRPDRRLPTALQSKWFSINRDDLEDGECRGLWVADDPESKLDDWLGYRYQDVAKWQAAKKKNFENFKKARRLKEDPCCRLVAGCAAATCVQLVEPRARCCPCRSCRVTVWERAARRWLAGQGSCARTARPRGPSRRLQAPAGARCRHWQLQASTTPTILHTLVRALDGC